MSSFREVARIGILASLGFVIAPSAQADTIFVSNEKSNTVSVVDGDKLEVVATIKVGRRPRGITFNEDMTQIFVCVGDDNRLAVIDVAAGLALLAEEWG